MYDEHVDFVWRSLVRLGVRDGELEDASQEVFLVVHRRLASFEGRAKLTTWLFRICYHVSLDRRRRAHNRHEVSAEGELGERRDSQPDAEALAQQRDDLALLEKALASMTLEQRAVFILFEFEEFTADEISATFEVPVGTVYSRLRRARALFQRTLKAARAAESRLLVKDGT